MRMGYFCVRRQKAGRSHRRRRRSQKIRISYFCVRSKKAGRSHRSRKRSLMRRRSQKIRMSYPVKNGKCV